MFCTQRKGKRAFRTPSTVFIYWDEEYNCCPHYWRKFTNVKFCYSLIYSKPFTTWLTFHFITFPLSYKVWGNLRNTSRMNWPFSSLFLFSKGQLLQRHTPTTAGRRIGTALSNVRPKPRANTERAQSFFSVSLEKVSSSPGWPDAGWHLIASEPAGWDETSGDKYQYHFRTIIGGSGGFFRTASSPASLSFC